MTVKEITEYILERINKDVLVQVYESKYSTYIRLDGGLCNSIRISNHESNKKHLNYFFNITTDTEFAEEKVVQTRARLFRYYYGTKELEEAINHINRVIMIKRNGAFPITYKQNILARVNLETHLNKKLKLAQLGNIVKQQGSTFI